MDDFNYTVFDNKNNSKETVHSWLKHHRRFMGWCWIKSQLIMKFYNGTKSVNNEEEDFQIAV